MFSKVERKENLFVFELDTLSKHVGKKKAKRSKHVNKSHGIIL